MDRSKKILFLITKSSWGGAQQYVYDIATHLPTDRFEAVVAAGGDGALSAKLRAEGIRTISIPGLQRDVGIMSEWRALREIVRLLKKECPDVVHLNSSKAAALGAIAVFLFRILHPLSTWKRGFQVLGNPVSKYRPFVIFTVHGWPFKEDRPFYQRAAIFLASWITCLFCDHIIVLGTKEEAAARRFLPRQKIAFIPHGLAKIDFYARADARAFFAEKIGRPIADNTILIGTIAELTKNKGLTYLIDALSLLWRRNLHAHYGGFASIVVVVMGEGEEHEKLQAAIRERGLLDAVFFIGFIPDAARFLPGMDIFILPSIKEGLPYAVIEAMAAGLPVIASRVGGIPDIIMDGVNGLLVEPKDPMMLAQALTRLIVSPDERARHDISGRARQKIATNFPFSAMMRRTISLYSRLPDAAKPYQ